MRDGYLRKRYHRARGMAIVSLRRTKLKPMQYQLGGRGGLMSKGVCNLVNTIIKYHLLFQYFPTINLCQFNNNVNNSHNKEQTTKIAQIPTIIINNNKILSGRRSLLTLFLCLMLNCIHLWLLRTFYNQEILHRFQNHFHGGTSQSFTVPFTKELPVMILRTVTP